MVHSPVLQHAAQPSKGVGQALLHLLCLAGPVDALPYVAALQPQVATAVISDQAGTAGRTAASAHISEHPTVVCTGL